MTTHIEQLIEETRQSDPVLAGQAALELNELQAVMGLLLYEWFRQPGSGGDVYCAYCGEHAWIGNDVVHTATCPVERGRRLTAKASTK